MAPGTLAPEQPKRPPLKIVALIAVLFLASLGTAAVSNGRIVAAVAPTLAFLVVLVLWKIPLRYSMYTVIFLIMTVDTPAEPFASGLWKSPLQPIALFLMSQLKNMLPSGALVMTGFELFVWGVLLVNGWRRARGSLLDRDDYVPLPRPVIIGSWLYVSAMLLASVLGLAAGGQFRWLLWQVQRNVGLPVALFAFAAAFPSPRGYSTYMRLLAIAAHIRAVLAVVLRFKFPDVEYTTSHSDSMLFATVTCYYLCRVNAGVSRGEAQRIVLSLIVLIAGMIGNDRRLVWVQLAMALTFVALMTPRNRFKVKVARTVLTILPFALMYAAAGWNSHSGVFAPVHMLRSVVDSKSDLSSLWRDLENFNLVATFSKNPLTGTGFGIPYLLKTPMPDITNSYELEPYLPHNGVLGLWAYTGYVGYTMSSMFLLVGFFLAARASYRAPDREGKVMSLTTFCSILAYTLQCYGDLGIGSWVGICLVGPSMVFTGRLATDVGAWPRFALKPRAAR